MTTEQKIDSLFDGYSFDDKQIYLKPSDIVSVTRHVRGTQSYDGPHEMTIREALTTGRWDTCNGTVSVVVLYGQWPVGLKNGRPFITVKWRDR